MVSAINPAFPVQGSATTQSVRQNFSFARAEISNLQTQTMELSETAPVITHIPRAQNRTYDAEAYARYYKIEIIGQHEFQAQQIGAETGILTVANCFYSLVIVEDFLVSGVSGSRFFRFVPCLILSPAPYIIPRGSPQSMTISAIRGEQPMESAGPVRVVLWPRGRYEYGRYEEAYS